MFQVTKSVCNKSAESSRPLLTSDCDVTVGVDNEQIEGLLNFPVNTKHKFIFGRVLGYYDAVLIECLESMGKEEKSEFAVSFSSIDTSKPSKFNLTLELHSFSEGKYLHELPVNVRIDISEQWKKAGNKFFTTGELCMAGYWYSKALKTMISCSSEKMDAETQAEFDLLLCQCRVNLAAVQLKRKLYNHVIENCTKALYVDQNMLKALYRRAQAYVATEAFDNAIKDLKLALKMQPKSTAMRTLLTTALEAGKREDDQM